MLIDGGLDAAIYGSDSPEDPRLRPVITDFRARAAAWQATHGFIPVNHVMVARADLARSNPAALREIYRMMGRSRAMSGSDLPLGFEALAPSLEMVIFYAWQQDLIPRRYGVAELFDDSRRILEE
jgi:4,5-dihydroxyphthalate decarboxylase